MTLVGTQKEESDLGFSRKTSYTVEDRVGDFVKFRGINLKNSTVFTNSAATAEERERFEQLNTMRIGDKQAQGFLVF